MAFRGEQKQIINYSEDKKLEYAMRLSKEREQNYQVVSELAWVCVTRGLRLIIENPYSTQHFLTRYWPLKPKWIDKDRTIRGDYYKKPTQYWFVNCEPKHNFVLEPQPLIETTKQIVKITDKAERSMIAPAYAERFIKEFILDQQVEGI